MPKESDLQKLSLEREELVLSHLDLARALAYRESPRNASHEDREDFIQIAFEQLLRSAHTFDFSYGASFTSYAYQGILLGLRRARVQSVSKSLELMVRVVRRAEKLWENEPDAPDVAVAEALGVTPDRLKTARERCDMAAGRIDIDLDNFRSRSCVEEDAIAHESAKRLQDLIKRLPAREVMLLADRLNGTRTYEIASQMGVSSQRVSQLWARILKQCEVADAA